MNISDARASIVIPVWNGATVIGPCLDALLAHSGDYLCQVVCVDNASSDESAKIVAERFPQVRLSRQPANLGFAGGINAGLDQARGDLFVLLNQDCLVQHGWLDELVHAFAAHHEFGIAGCAIFNADGALDHAGAQMLRPGAYGVHLTNLGDDQPRSVEYVTGAAMAIRRSTCEAIGRLDEGFYPAYYEEADYCFRARRAGIEIGYVPTARVTHLRSSREAQSDWIRHWANQHKARYRFVSKHFDSRELNEFFDFESAALEAESAFEPTVGRLLGARDALRALPDILERRRIDLREAVPVALHRQLQLGFTRVLRRSFAVAEKLGPNRPLGSQTDAENRWRKADQHMQVLLGVAASPAWPPEDQSGPRLQRLFRKWVMRPLKRLTRRSPNLPTTTPWNQIRSMERTEQLARQLAQLYLLFRDQRDQIDRRLTLLEVLTDYDYR